MSSQPGAREPLLIPGDTCWRIERTDRLAHVVDAAEYFQVAKAAMLHARKRIMLIGWDFDTRITFESPAPTLPGPNELGKFLLWLTRQNRDLEIYLLKWDLGTLTEGLSRGMPPVFLLNWVTGKRLHLQADSAHPPGAAHHQKIIVIDDAFAFCGGIDMSVDRWDTREHRDEDSRRIDPSGKSYGPWHDATVAVDADAARGLAELARDRWFAASGVRLQPLAEVPEAKNTWPEILKPLVHDVDVAIARTEPLHDGHSEVREVQKLYLAAIAAAEKTLYIENQYLASRTIAEAMADRLSEAEGPEIVLVLARHASGWFEQQTMDGAREKLLRILWKADKHSRLAVYYPVTAAGEHIYVHSKLLVLDDRMLRVGSSNLNNRSMGFDTECDVAFEVTDHTPAGPSLRRTIVDVRDDLVAEHLGCSPDAVRSAVEASGGSLIRAIEKLRGEVGSGRTLVPFDRETVAHEASPLAENDLLDPERVTPNLIERIRKVLNV